MDKTRFQISDDVWVDAERALWIESGRVLAVADMHLGYAWVQRARGALLPLVPDDTLERLLALQRRYRPDKFILLGDIVHKAAPIPALREAFQALITAFRASGTELVLVAGNHDRNLDRLTEGSDDVSTRQEVALAGHLFVHGDKRPEGRRHRIVMGHEHPCVRLGDGVTTSVKVPCFLVSERVMVLPAFSRWAAGSTVGEGRFLSTTACKARFSRAIAILGQKLLPVPLIDR